MRELILLNALFLSCSAQSQANLHNVWNTWKSKFLVSELLVAFGLYAALIGFDVIKMKFVLWGEKKEDKTNA